LKRTHRNLVRPASEQTRDALKRIEQQQKPTKGQ